MKKLFQRKVEKSYLLLVGVVSIFLIVGYFSYAYFTVQTEKANVITIKVGTLSVETKVDGVASNQLIVKASETKEFNVTIKNTNTRIARYNFYYKGNLSSGVEVGYVNEEGVNTPPEAKGVNINANGTQTYKIKVKNGTSSSQTITIASDVGLDYNDLKLPSGGHLFEEAPKYVIPEDTPLKEFINTKDYEESNDEEKKNMYVFEHEETKQQKGWTTEELTDYRYIGQDPNNYVTFNGENAGWRIIGVFTVENEKGVKEKRIKLIRKDPLQASDESNITWDNKPSGIGSSESEYGSNDWTDSRLMMVLNPGYDTNSIASGGKGSLYWNQGSGQCPYYDNEAMPCDFTTAGTGLNKEARDMIGDAKWYLGETGSITSGAGPEEWYGYERGTETCTTAGKCNKTRPIDWIGKIGLMYPSDYGYATGGGSSMNREDCLAKELYYWTQATDCATNDWLYDNNNYQWTITPCSFSAYYVFTTEYKGRVDFYDVNDTNYAVRPVVYLKSSVTLFQGTGTRSDPFVFV